MAKPTSEQALEDFVATELLEAGYLQRQTSAYKRRAADENLPTNFGMLNIYFHNDVHGLERRST